jgi:4-hydroxy-L-threonine phosphate dehydrogenase PdxA
LPAVIVCWIPALIAAAFAFFKINDLSLFNIILLMVEGFNKPSMRYWSSHGGISINLITSAATKEIAEADAKVATNAARLADITRQLEQRQEAMNRITSHDVPTPDDLEPIQTKLKNRLAQDDAPAADEATLNTEVTSASTLPVNKKRVSASGLDQSRSVDTIAQDIKTYEDQFAHIDQ